MNKFVAEVRTLLQEFETEARKHRVSQAMAILNNKPRLEDEHRIRAEELEDAAFGIRAILQDIPQPS